ncbi:MAG: LPS translocon maturation chaperone LptM [Acetobacteraceae bacterium]
MRVARRIVSALLAMVLISSALAGCGKKGAPDPPGPPSKVTWPRSYPTF